MDKIIGDEPCPKCRERGGDKTGNHLIVFENGNKYCNRCGYKEIVNGEENYEMRMLNADEVLGKRITMEEVSTLPSDALPDRHLRKETLEYFGVKVGYDESTREIDSHYYPVYHNGHLTGYKQRVLPKKFYSIGNTKNAQLFGQQLCGEGGKLIIITEGELDALAAHQILKDMGKNYRVVSLPSGANEKGLLENSEFLNKFENIVFCFDQDEVGKSLVAKVSDKFKPGSVKVMSFSEKDTCDMLVQGKNKEWYAALQNAQTKRPDGIVSGKDTWELIKNRPKIDSVPYPDGWAELNKQTYGIRLGELDTWTSGSGMGKTQVLRELQYHLLQTTDSGIGIIALEEPLADSVEALMSVHMNKRIHLPDVRNEITEEEMYEAWLATAGTNRLHFYDHFGSVDDDSLVSKIRFMANGLGCKYIFLDHLSIVVSEFAAEGGERERIDSIMTRLKSLTQELGIWLGLVVHLRKTAGGKSFEEGAIPTLDDLRGSGAIKQLSNSVFALSRNQQAEDDVSRNTSLLTTLKCRFTGRTGPADYLLFDAETGRMQPAELPITRETRDF